MFPFSTFKFENSIFREYHPATASSNWSINWCRLDNLRDFCFSLAGAFLNVQNQVSIISSLFVVLADFRKDVRQLFYVIFLGLLWCERGLST